jgi:hypothetical protein
MERTKWVDRKFSFGIPAGWLYNVIVRLDGAPVRIRELISGLDEKQLSSRSGDSWSIKEHIGHLSDLEELHDGRIDDFIAGHSELRPADMSNRKTYAASHNDRQADELLEEFSMKRREFINRLLALSDEVMSSESLHPRLNEMMKPVDMAYFTAEHDDHHIASIMFITEDLER